MEPNNHIGLLEENRSNGLLEQDYYINTNTELLKHYKNTGFLKP